MSHDHDARISHIMGGGRRRPRCCRGGAALFCRTPPIDVSGFVPVRALSIFSSSWVVVLGWWLASAALLLLAAARRGGPSQQWRFLIALDCVLRKKVFSLIGQKSMPGFPCCAVNSAHTQRCHEPKACTSPVTALYFPSKYIQTAPRPSILCSEKHHR